MFIRKRSWDQHLWEGQEGSRTGKRENLRWDPVPEKGWSGFAEYVRLEVIGWTFIPLGQSVTGCGLP